MSLVKYLFIACFLLCSTLQYSQENYPIRNFPPDMYNGELQNWKIAQDDKQNLFFANNQGVLEFNGASWKLYPSPNGSVLRSVNVKDSVVYIGCYKEFGYWDRNAMNDMTYKSLSHKIADKFLEDEEIWNILFFDRWVLFQSLRRIYVYDEENENFTIIASETNLPKVFKVRNSVYFQKMQKGLFRLENGVGMLVSNHSIFKDSIVVNIFHKDGALLVQTQDKGFFLLKDDGSVSKWVIASSKIVDELNVYSSLQLDDGNFVLGTISEGIYVLSNSGEMLSHIEQADGLLNNTVLSVFQDSQKNVWLGLDNGISMVDLPSPFLVYNDKSGKLGAVYSACIFDEKLYIGTNQGLFERPITSKEDFKFVKGTKGQVWCLNVIGEDLFCGHNSGTFLIKKNKAEQICNLMGTWNIQPLTEDGHLLIQGNYEGLHILEYAGGGWQYRNKVANFDMSSRFVELFGEKEVMVSHEYKGVFRLKLSDDYTKVLGIKQEDVQRGAKSGITKYNGYIFYFTEQGIFRFDEGKNKFYRDSIYTSSVLGEDTYISGKMITVSNRDLWAFTKENIIKITPGNFEESLLSTQIPISIFLRKDIAGYENLVHLDNENYLIGTSSGYIKFDLNKIKSREYAISLDEVSSSKRNGKREKLPIVTSDYEIKRNKNNVHFSFSVPSYTNFFKTKYQYKLEGFYEGWSKWSDKSMVSFDNLPAGEYIFKVKGKVGNIETQNIASYHFSIRKSWYWTDVMLALYLLIFIALFVVLNKWYIIRYRRKEQRLETEKAKELAVLQLENEKTMIKLRNDKLRSEVESKNRELASSAMNIVKKNELLSAIKSELKSSNSKEVNIKSVLKVIEENLTDNNDWEIFQEAFNNTDRDFLKKVKEKHQNLTHNDLKLCVYLRLNLSSKEIAPLLNISSRSVEIKRYRLRKKMQLNRGQNLNDYILSI